MTTITTEAVNGYAIRPKQSLQDDVGAQERSPIQRDVSPAPRRSSDLPRSASYTYIGSAKEQEYANRSLAPIKDSTLELEYSQTTEDDTDITTADSSGYNTPDEYVTERQLPKQHANELIAQLYKRSKDSEPAEDGSSSVASSIHNYRSSVDSANTVSTAATTPVVRTPRASVTSNFSRKLNRRSWIGSTPSTPSRSPSPGKKDATGKVEEGPTHAATTPDVGSTKRRKSFMKRKDSSKSVKEKSSEGQASEEQTPPPVSRKSTLLRRKSRPSSGIFKSSPTDENEPVNQAEPKRPPIPSLPKSFSTDKLPTLRSPQLSPGLAPPTPRLLSSDRKISSNLVPRKKDELWSVFRTLDGEFAKFASKSLAFKANVVRSSLIPFLRTYATHPSNRTLRPEDLDRRANILNKWWTGLIEMLHGRNNQSISGTDRPVILDGVSGIMDRPEWRLPPSPFSPLDQRMKASSSRNQSNSSLTSNNSDFLTESVHHNVRNIFVQNLSAQMAFVVDKMSLRNASASLVTFCGKACAYAFMFVPGMADILARLWNLPMDTIRRVLVGNGIGKFDDLSEDANAITSGFPPALHQLSFSSLMKYMRKLRTSPPLPLSAGNVDWWGNWLERWSGRESDLFYVFVKHFHMLVTDFLPRDATKTERTCAPGLLLVHAQILTNLDATIHRDVSHAQSDPTGTAASPTFDDVLADPDAVASALPIPPTNATRLMAENRLIMLIREFLSERAGDHPLARRLFAQSFNDLLEVAARGTSVFDHAACYTLLDFLEEAMALLVRFEHMEVSDSPLLDLNFWITVWKKMVSSQNTMTEIRLYAFLYTVWNTVICDMGWKAELCGNFLLEPETFESRFNHWCPMVRAYFMRLLCWRIGRYDGNSSFGDMEILEMLLGSLQTTWSYYLFLRQQAERQKTLPPPTNPCNPAPSRRLLIVRTDPLHNAGGAFLTFEGIASPKSPANSTPTALKRNSTLSVIEMDRPSSSRSTSDSESEPRGRGIGGFFRNLIGNKSRSKSQGPANSPSPPKHDAPPTPSPPNGIVRSATDGPQVPKPQSMETDNLMKTSQPAHRNFSFKFSLEFHPNLKQLPPMRLSPPRLPIPAHHLLQDHSEKANTSTAIQPLQPTGESQAHARYCGRALAEWHVVLLECQSFFDRRKKEGVPSDKLVETPTLGVEVFRRPG